MKIWSFSIYLFYLQDIWTNYIDELVVHDFVSNTFWTSFTFYTIGIMFLILTLLIISQTYALINIIKVMGNLMSKE